MTKKYHSNYAIRVAVGLVSPNWKLIREIVDKGEPYYTIAHSGLNDKRHKVCFAPLDGKPTQIEKNMKFIADAPEIVIQLLDEIEELKWQNQKED